MTFLPILRRELSVAARRPATYRQRVVFGGVATLTVVIIFAFSPITRVNGSTLFRITLWAGFVMALLEGLRVAADAIALERREGTLGLLLLTDARGYDVVTAKLASASIQALTTVIAMLPAFSLPLFMGGVTGGECIRGALTLLAAVFLAIAAGTLVSARCASALATFLGTLLLLILAMVPGTITTFFPAVVPKVLDCISGPLLMMLRTPDATFIGDPGAFVVALAGSAVFSGLAFLAAALLLHYFPGLEPENADTPLMRFLRPNPARNVSWDGASPRSSPAAWLAERTLPGRTALWVLVAVGVLVCLLSGVFAKRYATAIILTCEIAFAILVQLWVAAVAPLSLNNSRRNGALELLLCTPLTPREFVRGQMDAIYGYFMAPGLAVSGGFIMAGLAGMHFGRDVRTGPGESSLFVLGFFWCGLFFVYLHALAYVGLWFGLTTSRLDRAIAKTVAAVIVLPCLSLVLPVVGCLGILAWPIFWIYWAESRLISRFRVEAADPSAVTPPP